MGADPFTLLAIAGAANAGLGFIQNQRANKRAEQDSALARQQLAELQRERQTMPVADDESVRRARERSISAQMRRRGRASTILTSSGSSDALGVA